MGWVLLRRQVQMGHCCASCACLLQPGVSHVGTGGGSAAAVPSGASHPPTATTLPPHPPWRSYIVLNRPYALMQWVKVRGSTIQSCKQLQPRAAAMYVCWRTAAGSLASSQPPRLFHPHAATAPEEKRSFVSEPGPLWTHLPRSIFPPGCEHP